MRRARLVSAAALAVCLIAAAVAWASTGALTYKGCIAGKTSATNLENCPRTAKGMVANDYDGVAVSSDGKSVYVLSSGDFKAAIVHFQRSAQHAGKLTPIGCVGALGNKNPGCVKQARGLFSPADFAITPDGKSMYVSSRGGIVHLQRDTSNGELTPKGCIAPANSNPSNCSQTVHGLPHVTWLTISPNGKAVYLAGTDSVVRMKRDTASGNLTYKGCIGDAIHTQGCAETTKGLEFVEGLVMSANGKSLYASGSSSDAVVHFAVDPATGALTAKGCVADAVNNPAGCAKTAPGLYSPYRLATSPDGGSLYVGGGPGGNVDHFKTSSSGALTYEDCLGNVNPPEPDCSGSPSTNLDMTDVKVSADGKSVYGVDVVNSAVDRFARDTSTGALTFEDCVGDTGNNTAGCSSAKRGLFDVDHLALSQDNASVYASTEASALVHFQRAH